MARLIMMILAVLTVYFACQCTAWNDLQTTFRVIQNSDKPPKSLVDAKALGWTKVSDCCSTPDFAGIRMLKPTKGNDLPDKIMIYNQKGDVAGMQSLIPAKDFVGGDCTDNEFYTKQKITIGKSDKEFCMATIYYFEPDTICSWHKSSKGDTLYLQRGTNNTGHMVIPRTYDEAKADSQHWHMDKYFLGMGHHVTSAIRCNATVAPPVEALYAWFEGECRLTGFAWSHSNTKTAAGTCWEKPNNWMASYILTDPPQCVMDMLDKGLVTTQHVFLAKSTKHCTLPFVGKKK